MMRVAFGGNFDSPIEEALTQGIEVLDSGCGMHALFHLLTMNLLLSSTITHSNNKLCYKVLLLGHWRCQNSIRTRTSTAPTFHPDSLKLSSHPTANSTCTTLSTLHHFLTIPLATCISVYWSLVF